MADLFNQMLSRYEIRTKDEKLNALHEVMQQVTLAGLHRGGFFNNAAFYGGTCLRIFHKLPRFSEDMDFSLLQKDDSFNVENYFESILGEFKSLGREVVIEKRYKKMETPIESAFLKDSTDIYNVKFQTERMVKIKIEVDKDPPLLFSTENRLLLHPYSFMTKCFTLPDLFAGKMHALIFRKWKSRIKGRDWYDFEWYVRNGIKLDFIHFKERAAQSENDLNMKDLSVKDFMNLLKEKLSSMDIERVKEDVRPFIKNSNDMEIWSTDYFLQLADMVEFE
ncbi:MAG: nucleotidyl transferase AbiEii/AbiGii toxin family protein [Prolixibacteraceae bacterium]